MTAEEEEVAVCPLIYPHPSRALGGLSNGNVLGYPSVIELRVLQMSETKGNAYI